MGFDSGEKRWEGGSEGCRGEVAQCKGNQLVEILKLRQSCAQGKDGDRRFSPENGVRNHQRRHSM